MIDRSFGNDRRSRDFDRHLLQIGFVSKGVSVRVVREP